MARGSAGGVAWRGVVPRGRGLAAGRGLPAERGRRARRRLAAWSRRRGDCCGGRSRRSGAPRAAAVLLAGAAPARPPRDGDPAALCRRTPASQPRAPGGKLSARRCSRGPGAVPERPPPDSTSGSLHPEPLPEPSAGARGESGVHGGERGEQDTDDGQTDLACGLLLSPPPGSRSIYPKRRRAELRRSSETFPVAPGGSGQGVAGFAKAR